MTRTRSIYNVTEMLRKLNDYGKPGKKKFQKLIYLIENLGNVNLGFQYEIYFYGPYSSDLDNVLAALEGEGLIHYDYQGLSHLICVDEPSETNDFSQDDLNPEEHRAIEDIYKRFGTKTANELELLTTTHFAFKNLADKSPGSIINGVKKIKGSKYSDQQINKAITELQIPVQ